MSYNHNSECLLLALFQLYHDKYKITFDDMMMIDVCYVQGQYTYLYVNSATSLKQLFAGRHVI